MPSAKSVVGVQWEEFTFKIGVEGHQQDFTVTKKTIKRIAAISQPLYNMMMCPMEENRTGCARLEEDQPNIFEHFLQWLKGGHFAIENVTFKMGRRDQQRFPQCNQVLEEMNEQHQHRKTYHQVPLTEEVKFAGYSKRTEFEHALRHVFVPPRFQGVLERKSLMFTGLDMYRLDFVLKEGVLNWFHQDKRITLIADQDALVHVISTYAETYVFADFWIIEDLKKYILEGIGPLLSLLESTTPLDGRQAKILARIVTFVLSKTRPEDKLRNCIKKWAFCRWRILSKYSPGFIDILLDEDPSLLEALKLCIARNQVSSSIKNSDYDLVAMMKVADMSAPYQKDLADQPLALRKSMPETSIESMHRMSRITENKCF